MGYTTYANVRFAWFPTESGRVMVICDHGALITSHRARRDMRFSTPLETWYRGKVIISNETLEVTSILDVREDV